MQGDPVVLRAMVGLLAVLLGGVAGVGVRLLLARLRRGAVMRVGVTETATAVVTGIGTAVGWGRPTIAMILLAGLLMVMLGAVDIVHHRLPDAITLVALPLAAVTVIITHLLVPASGSLLRAAISALVLWGLFAAMAHISSSWMGGGDVKLIPTLGLLMGYESLGSVLVGLLIAFGSGSVAALAGVATRRLRLRSAIPLGPYLLFGCWVVLLFPVLR